MTTAMEVMKECSCPNNWGDWQTARMNLRRERKEKAQDRLGSLHVTEKDLIDPDTAQ